MSEDRETGHGADERPRSSSAGDGSSSAEQSPASARPVRSERTSCSAAAALRRQRPRR